MGAMILYSKYVLIYFLAVGVAEYIWFKKQNRPYDFREAAVSLGDFAMRRLVIFWVTGNILLWMEPWLSQFSLQSLAIKDGSGWNVGRLALLFLGVEFIYYWHHRLSHEIRWFWATHVVHHSPNSMNVLTAERLGWTQNLSNILIIYAPLVLIGFSAKDVLTVLGFNLLYQFWLHTEMFGQLGWFEFLFNTPAHHRVHHASNPRYLDSNYGGILIIFDRIFGTFVQESADEKVIYGLVHPVRSLNPVFIALHEWMHMGRDLSKNWRYPSRVLGYMFGPPGWKHDGSGVTSEKIRSGLDQSQGTLSSKESLA